MLKKLCFIGPGKMGSGMVTRLSSLQSNYKIYAWSSSNKSVEKLRLSTPDIIGCHSLFEAVQDSHYILSCLPTTDDVYNVINECTENNYINNDCIWLDFTSGDPRMITKITNNITTHCDKNIDFIDCPVSGGPHGAKNGTLTCMVGCNDETIFEQCKNEVFQHISTNPVHVGPIGSGYTIKSINNLLNVTNLVILSEGLKCSTNYGIDINIALNVINNSSGRSLMSQERFPKHIIQNNYHYGFELGLMKKDVDIASNLLQGHDEINLNSNISETVKKLLDYAINKYGGDADYTNVAKLYDIDLAGTKKSVGF